nr:reverse transcriptase domain-containing protein [Tanacetum cinerariifolium]
MPSHIKTYDESEDPKNHLKNFQAAAKIERWALPTWCHMFNSTLTGNEKVWFDDLPPESIDSYDDLKKAFLENYLQQKKCIKDPIELHNIKHRDGESIEDFVRRYKLESRDVKGAPEQKITQSFSPNTEILFIPLDEEKGTEEPTGASYHPLIGFSGEIIRPIGQIQLMVRIGDEEHSALAWINFVVLKNVRRFQRFKQSMPETWLSATRNRPEVYVDELVIKSRTEDEMVRDIEETFKTLREINMKLNPKKCTFGVEEGMFLGYKVNTRGLKVCPDKVDAVLSLPSPKYLKDVQKLNRKLASLNRFLAKSAEKSLLFFKTLRKCTKKSDSPMEKEELIIYLAASKETISAVLMTEREAKQMPIYFVSRALRGPEINYSSMEKFVLALVYVSKHLKRYFQAHPIIVTTNQSIQQVLSRQKVAGRLQKWSIELGEYAIHYRPRVSVKGQILVSSYNAMPFGLRNAGATYQRLVDKAFHKQIGRNLKVYVDELVIKSRTEDEMVRDIEETFKTL